MEHGRTQTVLLFPTESVGQLSWMPAALPGSLSSTARKRGTTWGLGDCPRRGQHNEPRQGSSASCPTLSTEQPSSNVATEPEYLVHFTNTPSHLGLHQPQQPQFDTCSFEHFLLGSPFYVGGSGGIRFYQGSILHPYVHKHSYPRIQVKCSPGSFSNHGVGTALWSSNPTVPHPLGHRLSSLRFGHHVKARRRKAPYFIYSNPELWVHR